MDRVIYNGKLTCVGGVVSVLTLTKQTSVIRIQKREEKVLTRTVEFRLWSRHLRHPLTAATGPVRRKLPGTVSVKTVI